MALTAELHQKTPYTRGLWQFQESLLDESGNAFHFALTAGNQRYVDMRPGLRGLKLFSDSKYNHATLDTLLKITGDVTVMMLALFDSYSAGAIFAYDNVGETAADNVHYAVEIGSNESLLWFQEQGTGVDESHTFQRLPPLFQVCHLAFRRKNTVVEAFINGRRFGVVSLPLPVPTGGGSSSLFLGYEGNNAATVTIASLRIDARALSENEIANEYNRTLGPVLGKVTASGPTPLYATELGGTNEFWSIGNVTPTQKERTDSFSLFGRVRTTNTGYNVICGKTVGLTAGQNLRGYDLYFWGDAPHQGKIALNLNNNFQGGGNFLSVRTQTAFNDGNWHDVLATYDGTSTPAGCKIYVDGTEQTLDTVNNTLSATIANTAAFCVGIQSTLLGAAFVGTIREVAFYNAVVSASDARLITLALPYRSLHTVGPAANLVGWWLPRDPTAFTTIHDASVNANNGTMTNMEQADIVEVAA